MEHLCKTVADTKGRVVVFIFNNNNKKSQMKMPETSFDHAKETPHISNARTAVYAGDIISMRNGSMGIYLNC